MNRRRTTRTAVQWAMVAGALQLTALSGCVQNESTDETESLTLSDFSSCHRRIQNVTTQGCEATEPSAVVEEIPNEAICRSSLVKGESPSNPDLWIGVWITDRSTVHIEFAKSPWRSDLVVGSASLESDGVTHRIHGHDATAQPGSRFIITTSFAEDPSTIHGKMMYYTIQAESNHSSLQPQAWTPRVLDVEYDGRTQPYYIWAWSDGPYWFDPMGITNFNGRQSLGPRSIEWSGEDFSLKAGILSFGAGVTIDTPPEPIVPLPPSEHERCTFPPWY